MRVKIRQLKCDEPKLTRPPRMTIPGGRLYEAKAFTLYPVVIQSEHHNLFPAFTTIDII